MRRLLLLCCVLLAVPAFAQAPLPPSQGQVLYLPIYSHILYGDITSAGKPMELLLSVQISVRNADPSSPIRVPSVQYFDGTGTRLTEFAAKPVMVPPLGAHEFYVPKSDSSGGTGASMVVRWQSDKPVNPPVVEAVHAEVAGTRGLSFVTTARPIADGK